MAPRDTHNGAAAAQRRTTTGGRDRPPVRRRSHDVQDPRATGRPRACEPPSATRWWAVPLAIVVILAGFGFAYYPVARVQYREVRERARLSAELEALKARNMRLEAEVARLQTPEGVEDYARTQLGLVKRGEHVVVVRREDGSLLSTAAPGALGVPDVDSDYVAVAPVGPWTGVLDLIFGVR